jgi:hypothetical protein
MKTYQEVTNQYGETYLEMKDENGGIWFVPIVESNSDYQRYLNPEAEQSTPIVINEAETI